MTENLAVCNRCRQAKIPTIKLPFSERLIRQGLYCDECQAVVEAEEKQRKDQTRRNKTAIRAANMENLLAWVGVPKRFWHCSLENFEGKLPRRRPMFITGPAGTGKTHLAVAYLREEIIAQGAEQCKFLEAVELFLELRDSFRRDSPEDEERIIKTYTSKPFLVIDDLGAEKVSDYVRQSLYFVINRRYGEELPTVVTSNLTLDQIAEVYGERLSSRIAGMGPELVLKGRDRRWQRQK